MPRTRILAAALVTLGAAALFPACGGDDDDASPRRVVEIVQTDGACTPLAIEVKAGEKIQLSVRNDGKKDKEVEGIEGTDLEEVLVPSGKTRTMKYNVPNKAGVQKIKCYTPNADTTVIELKVSP